MEGITGSRFHASLLLPTRLRYDIPISFLSNITTYVIHFTSRLKELHSLLTNRLFISRLHEIGLIPYESVMFYSLSGPVARGSGVLNDCRLMYYDVYGKINWNTYLYTVGDCLDRIMVRFNEITESCRIIYACSYLLLTTSGITSKSASTGTMEGTIEEFLTNQQYIADRNRGFKVAVESGKGISSLYVHLYPYTMNIVSNDFLVINSLPKYCTGVNIGDLIAMLGSLDFVLGSVDL